MSAAARAAAALAVIVVLAASLAFVVSRAREGGPPTLDDRTMAIAQDLRCPVCSGESVAASSSAAAVQMRTRIRHELLAGRSADQIRAWFAQRYGPQVLMTPSGGIGLVAWLGPIALLAIAIGATVLVLREHPTDEPEPTA